ncbi:hypothetical protein [Flavobacterium sp. AED]|uniref:hypothetical protein n=1 Tax=Flavobacterium sp. AED TaxID=1423323 RepID=UPI0012E0426C|nr:hypothetical protein [Flavobacterium sp. AED]
MRKIMGAFYDLDTFIQRLYGIEVPIPYAVYLERATIPQRKKIINTVKKMIRHD